MNAVQAEAVDADAYFIYIHILIYVNICMDFAFKGKTSGEMPVLFF